MSDYIKISFELNGEKISIEVSPCMSLLDILREKLGLTGTKEGCREGTCGACTVLLDGKAVNSCLVLAPDVNHRSVITIEGISENELFEYLQKAFIEEGAIGCGYCTSGMIMFAIYFLRKNSDPTLEEIKKALTGNLCRCTGYESIIRAIMKTSKIRKQQRIGLIREAMRKKAGGQSVAGKRR